MVAQIVIELYPSPKIILSSLFNDHFQAAYSKHGWKSKAFMCYLLWISLWIDLMLQKLVVSLLEIMK